MASTTPTRVPKSRILTYALDNFGGGLDLREGIESNDQNRFLQMNNCYVTNGRKIKRRMPLRVASGQRDAKSQGLVFLEGSFYTFAPKGTTIAHTIVLPYPLVTLYFDLPDYCTTATAWTLIDAKIQGGKVSAYIQHAYPGNVVTSRQYLHVFDGLLNKPTYSEDPNVPTNWSPSLPVHIYGQGVAGTFAPTFKPAMFVAGSKLVVSRPDRNTAFSRIAKPRYFNTWTYSQMGTQGEMWYFFAPQGQGTLLNFVVSEDFSKLQLDQTWSAYILEYLDATGTWQKFLEDSSAPTVNGHYFPAAIASRFSGGWANEIQLQVKWTGAADTIFRFRMLAGLPPLVVASGATFFINTDQWLVPAGTKTLAPTYATLPQQLANGDGSTTVFTTALGGKFPIGTGPKVYVNGVLKTLTTDYTLSSIAAPTGNIPATFLVVTFLSAPASPVPIEIFYDVAGLSPPIATFEGSAVSYADPTSPYGSGQPYALYGGKTVYYAITRDAQPQQIWPVVTPGIIPMNGYQRYFINIFTAVIYAAGPPASLATPLSVMPYYYGANLAQPSAFYTAKQFDYIVNQAGNGEAGFINTSDYDNGNGTPSAISGVLDRVVIHFPSSTQLWQFEADPSQNKMLDQLEFGTAYHTHPVPVKFYDSVLTPAATGIRGVSVSGANLDNLQDNNVGDPIVNLSVVSQTAACFWAWTGQYVSAGIVDGLVQFLVLSYSKESKISAWSTWVGAGLTTVDYLIAYQGQLFVSSGLKVFYFDATSLSFVDDQDPVVGGKVVPYYSVAQWHYNNFQKPGFMKQIHRMDVVQQNSQQPFGASTCSFEFAYIPALGSAVAVGPTIKGVSLGARRIPLGIYCQGVSVIATCNDPLGWEFQGILMDYVLKAR